MNSGKICISICVHTAKDLINQIKSAKDLADVIEIRLDCLKTDEIYKLSSLPASGKSLLLTYRPKEQGGKTEAGLHQRIAFWKDFAVDKPSGFFVDLEFDLPPQILTRQFQKIGSFHDFSGIPDNLEKIYEILSAKSDIIKIAVQTNDIADSIAVWKLLEKAKGENRKIIPIAMGESGKWTRILGLAHGAFMTYAAPGSGQETAPGQISAKDLTEVYRVKDLNENTEIYGILGNNTGVSMSPYIHNAAFAFHKLNAVFVPLQTYDLDEFMRRMVKPETREINLNFKGFSVTIPHKQAIIKHLDFLDETAEKIGAVNTVKIIDGKLYGYNTDAKGFIGPLLNSYGDLSGVKIAVLGAGGAARACVYALRQHGAEVTVFARNTAKAGPLANDFQIELKEFSKSKTDFSNFDILVNTTPLGMKGKFDSETPAVAEQLKGLHLVYDLVYIPFQTPLLTEADKAEVPKIGGLAMLIAQAMEQQKIWTGLEAPMKEMSRAALKKSE
jgi:3-dehydroquinate dehydratase/shikimate dehydrogenase